MQIALDALEANLANWAEKTKAVKALRQALETEQEPVCWTVADGWVYANDTSQVGTSKEVNWETLYTAPPKQWVGLTDEEIAQGLKESWVTEQAWQSAVWWAEAKLKEKNKW
jgi:hypothetical protein